MTKSQRKQNDNYKHHQETGAKFLKTGLTYTTHLTKNTRPGKRSSQSNYRTTAQNKERYSTAIWVVGVYEHKVQCNYQ